MSVREIRDLSGLTREVEALITETNLVWWFRGHSNVSWPLLPSVRRGYTREQERVFLKRILCSSEAAPSWDCARNGEDKRNSPKQETTDLIRVSRLQILARKIFIRNPNPGGFHRAVLPDGQRLCVIHVGRCLIKRCEVSLHCHGIFCLKQTTPTAVLAGLLVLQDRVRCFGRQRRFFPNSREAIGQSVFFN
jgi:hypothetical protein